MIFLNSATRITRFHCGVGEKSALVPYSASSSNPCNSVCISAGVIEHLSSFGSCIPPPAISGQYFVGNMIRPSNMSSSIPIFSNPPPPILSRLPVTPSANLVAKGKPYPELVSLAQYSLCFWLFFCF